MTSNSNPGVDRETALALQARALEIRSHEFKRAQLLSKLSAREQQILEVLSTGLSDREISDHLAISVDTVRTHFVHILEKLGVRTRLQAVVLSQEYDLTRSRTT
jgi:DNA-binding NarL/FixJ family response regulator